MVVTPPSPFGVSLSADSGLGGLLRNSAPKVLACRLGLCFSALAERSPPEPRTPENGRIEAFFRLFHHHSDIGCRDCVPADGSKGREVPWWGLGQSPKIGPRSVYDPQRLAGELLTFRSRTIIIKGTSVKEQQE